MAEKGWWLDEPKNVRKLVYLLAIVCGLLLVIDLVYHKHGVFAWEEWFASYAVFGFLAGSAVVLGAKELRKLIRRDEDYYDR